LLGRRIVVTRAQGQAERLCAGLRLLGAGVIELPVIEIRPAADYGPLDSAIARLGEYDWLIFTSVNGVQFFMERLQLAGTGPGAVRARICAIGPATKNAVEKLRLKVDLVPKQYVAESLIEAFAGHALAGKRILLPRAAVARDLVPAELSGRGAVVDVVEAYRTVIPEDAAQRAQEIFGGGKKPDWITFTSSSTVVNFIAAAGREALDGVKIASIGPVTTRTARRNGLEVTVEASPYTMDGLVAAIAAAGK